MLVGRPHTRLTGGRRIAWYLVLILGVLTICVFPVFGGSSVLVTRIDGDINFGTRNMFLDAISRAELRGAEALVVELNTNGGTLEDTEEIIRAIKNSGVPVVIYVHPRGSVAFSAGTFILMASHVAAMTPGTSIGAAEPIVVDPTGGVSSAPEKVKKASATLMRSTAEEMGRPGETAEKFVLENLTLTADQALEAKVVEIVAGSVEELVPKLDGMEVLVKGVPHRFSTSDARVERFWPSPQNRFVASISDPTVAYLLLMLGLWGLLIGFYSPGWHVPETIGVVCLLLALFALGKLGVSVAGLIFLITAIGFFIVEAKTPTFGLFAAAGVVCLLIGSFLLFPGEALRQTQPEIAKNILTHFVVAVVVVTAALSAFFIFGVGKVIKARRKQPTTGREALTGREVVVIEELAPEGMVKLGGELWRAVSEDGERIKPGERVVVKGKRGLTLYVSRRRPGEPGQTGPSRG